MKLTDLKKLLFSIYGESLKPLGFKKVKYGFMKINGDYAYNFIFSSLDRDNSFPTGFFYGLGSKSIANIIKKVVAVHEDNSFYPMIGWRQVVLWEAKKYPVKDYDIYTEDDAEKMVAEVSAYFTNEALPYLESISNLHALEALTNSNPHPLKFRSGLVLAKLVENPKYDSLVEQYRESFKGWVVEWDKMDFEKIVSFLDCHSLDELHAMA